MTTNNDELLEEANAVETEVAKGEQNEILEEHPLLEKETLKKEPRPKSVPKTSKQPTAPKVSVKRISPRLEELARPVMNKVLFTLRDKACVLSPALVDNLTRIVEAETCLNPEEAARVLRRKRKVKKGMESSSFTKKLAKEIRSLDEIQAPPILDKSVTVCQYLLAVNFVKSILESQCQTPRKDLRELVRVIFKRLKSIDDCIDDGNDGDRVTQQLQVLSEIIACWIAEILAEVAEAEKETLEEYCRKKEMRKIDVDDDEETDSEAEYWERIGEEYEIQKKDEDKVVEKENIKKKDVEDNRVEQKEKSETYIEEKEEQILTEKVPEEEKLPQEEKVPEGEMSEEDKEGGETTVT